MLRWRILATLLAVTLASSAHAASVHFATRCARPCTARLYFTPIRAARELVTEKRITGPDSFAWLELRPGTAEVRVVDLAGRESDCAAFFTINGVLDVPPQTPSAAPVIYDLAGRVMRRPLPPGVYLERRPGVRAKRVVVLL